MGSEKEQTIEAPATYASSRDRRKAVSSLKDTPYIWRPELNRPVGDPKVKR